jgi:hypothetical protein
MLNHFHPTIKDETKELFKLATKAYRDELPCDDPTHLLKNYQAYLRSKSYKDGLNGEMLECCCYDYCARHGIWLKPQLKIESDKKLRQFDFFHSESRTIIHVKTSLRERAAQAAFWSLLLQSRLTYGGDVTAIETFGRSISAHYLIHDQDATPRDRSEKNRLCAIKYAKRDTTNFNAVINWKVITIQDSEAMTSFICHLRGQV